MYGKRCNCCRHRGFIARSSLWREFGAESASRIADPLQYDCRPALSLR